MFFYLPGVIGLATYYIFHSKGIDYRAVGIGALLPVVIDIFVGHMSFGHSFLFPIALLVVIMIGTMWSSRLLRRRLLCINIGIFFGLFFNGTFLHETMWWWPLNIGKAKEVIPIFPSPLVWVIRDVVGLIALYVLFSIGELNDKQKRIIFFRTGRISS